MAIEVHEERGANVAAWSGWDAAMLDALLDAESGPHAIGFTLARALASRVLPSPAARFRFRLYRYCHEDGSYRFVGAWNEQCLEEGAVPQPSELLERQEASAEPPKPESRSEAFLDDELFLPLETNNGVLGFGVLRVDSPHEPTRISSQDLHFLGRLTGAALGRLNESDRAVRMHRSFESASRHLDGVLSMTREAIIVVDVKGIVRIANDPAMELFRQAGNELIGRPVSNALSRDAATSLHRALLQAEESEGRICAQIPMEHEGQLREFEVAVQQLQTDIEIEPTLLVRFRLAENAEPTPRTSDRDCRTGGPGLRPEAPMARPDFRDLPSGEESSLPVDEADTLRRHVRSIRGYLGLLGEDVDPRSRSFELLRQLQAQMEWLQVQADVHALLESIRAGEVIWQRRSVRVTTLVDRGLAQVSAGLALRGIASECMVDPAVGRVRLDFEKWSVALGVLIDRATEHQDGGRVLIRVPAAQNLSVSIEFESASDRSVSLSLDAGEDDRIHGLTLVHHMVDLHEGRLSVDLGDSGAPVVRLDLPVPVERKGTHGHAA